jgi:3'-5' exoribonuclease
MGIRISDIEEGQKVAGIYLVRHKQIATTRAGKTFLTLKLGDRSGEVEAKVWEEADRISKIISSGDFIKIKAQANLYNGKLQLTLQKVERIDDQSIDPSDFLPSSPRDPDEMIAELKACIQKVKDPHLRKLLKKIFEEKELMDKFRRAPAAKSMHHAYVGGLLEHTLSLFHLCERVMPHFPEVDRDLLRSGVLLHDVGKVDELSYARSFDYTDRGRLMGHIVLELEMVSGAINSLSGFPEEKAILLKHLMVAHHGKEEFGSPVKPMTLEALILHMLDDLDAKAQTFRALMSGSQDERWSAYHPLLGHYVFKGFPETGTHEGAGKKQSRPVKNEDKDKDKDKDKDLPTLF